MSSNSPVSRWLGAILSSNRLPLYVWASLASQILIVVTGGVVRLTGSGLGCPTWPKCTDASLVTVPEQGIHGVIEFGNRLLTFVLLVIALLTLFTILRMPNRRQKRMLSMAVALIAGIFVQAVVGGLSVRIKLNPWIVGSHFLISAVMIALASILVWRFYEPRTVLPAQAFGLAPFVTLVGGLTVLVGVLVTGAGPHAGDTVAARNGLDIEIWEHYHSYPAYLLLLLLLVQLLVLGRAKAIRSLSGLATLLTLGLCVLQALVGVAQARLGVPAGLVGVHVTGAAVLCSLITFNHLALRSK